LFQIAVCLRKLEDYANAFTAFERGNALATAATTTSATGITENNLRNPLIHLNFGLFCCEIGRYDLANQLYNQFINASKDIILPSEVSF